MMISPRRVGGAQRVRAARPGAMPAPHSTPRRDSPSDALIIEQLGGAPPTTTVPA